MDWWVIWKEIGWFDDSECDVLANVHAYYDDGLDVFDNSTVLYYPEFGGT